MSIIETENLVMTYNNKAALNGLTLKAEKGKIVGLLGPNGSGKTTFLKIAAGLEKPDSGSILIDGIEPGARTKSFVAFLPDENYFYNWMRVKDAIHFFDTFFEDFDNEKAMSLVSDMDIEMNDMVKGLSKGVAERLRISLVLSRKAKLCLLDEPLGGIDIIKRDGILDLIRNNYNEEGTIILATHLIEDVERIFDDVCFISEGKVVFSGICEDLRVEKQKSVANIYREVLCHEKTTQI